jgi:hypothetical protein
MKNLIAVLMFAIILSSTIVAQDEVKLVVGAPMRNGSIQMKFWLYADAAGRHGDSLTVTVTGILATDTAADKMMKIRTVLGAPPYNSSLRLDVAPAAMNECTVRDGRRNPADPNQYLDIGISLFEVIDSTSEISQAFNNKIPVRWIHVETICEFSGTPQGGYVVFAVNETTSAMVDTFGLATASEVHNEIAAQIPGSVVTANGVQMPVYLASDRFFYFDVADAGLDIRVSQVELGGGQAPMPGVATLDVNNALAYALPVDSAQPGPYYTDVIETEMVALSLTGMPQQPVVMLLGDIEEDAWNFGLHGQLDLDPASLQIIGDGTLPGGWNSMWVIPSSGELQLSFPPQPALSGTTVGLQAAIFNPLQIVQLSNAVEVQFK